MIISLILLFSITFLAYFVKGVTGFGNTLVMNSLFSFFKENRFTTPVDLLLGLPANIYLAWQNRHTIDMKMVVPLSISVILGDVSGIFLLRTGSDHLLKAILGTVLILLSIEMLFHKNKLEAQICRPFSLWITGAISGTLMGLFGIGALLAAYITRYSKNRNDYRGNLCCIFVVDNLFRFFGYWWSAIINWQIIKFTLLLIPAAVTGMWLSRKIDIHFSEDSIRKFIFILLIVSGVFLIIHNSNKF